MQIESNSSILTELFIVWLYCYSPKSEILHSVVSPERDLVIRHLYKPWVYLWVTKQKIKFCNFVKFPFSVACLSCAMINNIHFLQIFFHVSHIIVGTHKFEPLHKRIVLVYKKEYLHVPSSMISEQNRMQGWLWQRISVGWTYDPICRFRKSCWRMTWWN